MPAHWGTMEENIVASPVKYSVLKSRSNLAELPLKTRGKVQSLGDNDAIRSIHYTSSSELESLFSSSSIGGGGGGAAALAAAAAAAAAGGGGPSSSSASSSSVDESESLLSSGAGAAGGGAAAGGGGAETGASKSSPCERAELTCTQHM
jgi:hypothetical protein